MGTLAAYDSNKKYMVVAQNYTNATSTQKPRAFMCDDSDLAIQDERRPYVWGGLYNGGSGFAGNDPTDLPERHANEWYSDGFPVNPGSHSAISRFVNNAINYKTTISIPWIFEGGPKSTPSSAKPDWVLFGMRPVGIGAGYVVGQTQRTWRVRPQLRSSSAGQSVDVRVTFCRNQPTNTSGTDVVFVPPFTQLTFSSTSATYEIATRDTAEPVVNPETGEGWIVVEGRSANSSTLDLLGFAEFDLGPFS